jgi:hypothetical protein
VTCKRAWNPLSRQANGILFQNGSGKLCFFFVMPRRSALKSPSIAWEVHPLCMGGPFLALYSLRPGACVAETRVTEAETSAAITGEEPALAMAAVAMIRGGKWQSEPIPPAGAGIWGVEVESSGAEIWGATVQSAKDRFPLLAASGQEAGKPFTAGPIRPRARIRAVRLAFVPIQIARIGARLNRFCRAGAAALDGNPRHSWIPDSTGGHRSGTLSLSWRAGP